MNGVQKFICSYTVAPSTEQESTQAYNYESGAHMKTLPGRLLTIPPSILVSYLCHLYDVMYLRLCLHLDV